MHMLRKHCKESVKESLLGNMADIEADRQPSPKVTPAVHNRRMVKMGSSRIDTKAKVFTQHRNLDDAQ